MAKDELTKKREKMIADFDANCLGAIVFHDELQAKLETFGGLSRVEIQFLLERYWLSVEMCRYGSDRAPWVSAQVLADNIADVKSEAQERATLRPSVRYAVLRRDQFTCQYCGARAPEVRLHVDHVLPVCRGGGNDPANLKTACAACNLGKGAGSHFEQDEE